MPPLNNGMSHPPLTALSRLSPAATHAWVTAAMAIGAAFLLGGNLWSQAADDDLLDPKMARSDLLPAAPRGPATATDAAPATGGPRHTPSHARAKSAEVVSSLVGLADEVARLMKEEARLKAAVEELWTKWQKQKAEKKVLMDDYRSGLFCSGCGKTKTQILALNERFPHPNETIVQPTDEQIAAKDRELQAPLDRMERDLQELRERHSTAQKMYDEAGEQFEYGFQLWRTANVYEKRLYFRAVRELEGTYRESSATAEAQVTKLKKDVRDTETSYQSGMGNRNHEWRQRQQELEQMDATYVAGSRADKAKLLQLKEALKEKAPAEVAPAEISAVTQLGEELARREQAYQAARAPLEKQIAQLDPKQNQAAHTQKMAALARDLEAWSARLEAIKTRYYTQMQEHGERVHKSSLALKNEQEILNDCLREELEMTKHVTVRAIIQTHFLTYPGNAGFVGIGGFYRMGDYSPARHRQVLPSVREFIDAYVATPMFGDVHLPSQPQQPASGDAPPSAPPPPAPAGRGLPSGLLDLP